MPKTKINFITKPRVVIVIKNGNAEVFSEIPLDIMVIDRNFDGVENKDLTKFHVKRKQVNGKCGAINDKYTAYANLQDTDYDPAMVDQFWKQSHLQDSLYVPSRVRALMQRPGSVAEALEDNFGRSFR
jgi:hypothetical protein